MLSRIFGAMKKASEYRQHAEECRALAQGMSPGEHLDQLLKMAEHWEQMAIERSDLVARHPELAIEGEDAEERARFETTISTDARSH